MLQFISPKNGRKQKPDYLCLFLLEMHFNQIKRYAIIPAHFWLNPLGNIFLLLYFASSHRILRVSIRFCHIGEREEVWHALLLVIVGVVVVVI